MSINDITLNVASVCNLTLSHLGMKAITDLDTDVAANNPSAIAINKQWGPVRNDLLREYPWAFSKCIGTITHRTDVTDDDYPEWEFFTTYPSAAVTIWHVFDESTVSTKHENQFEIVYNPSLNERIVCCNLDTQNTAYAEYSYNVTDTLLWDTKFIMAFSFRLAAAICVELTGDSDKAQELSKVSNIYIPEAKRISSSEAKSKPTQSNPIVDARG